MAKNRIKPRDSRNLFYHDGAWWVDVQINGRRYREIAGRTEAQARAYRDKLKSWKRDSDLGLPAVKPEGETVKFAAFADKYLALYAKRKRSYARDAISIAHLKAFFSGWNLKDINAEAVARYRASRVGLSPATINRELACLRTALRKGVEWGSLSAYPLPTENLLEKEKKFKPRILEPAEARCLVAAADPRWLRPAIVVWLATGLRKMELLKLRRADVDFKKRLLTVVAENAKSGEERTIPMSEAVTETLRAMPGEMYFFENPETKTHVRDLIESFRTALGKAKIIGRVRIHDLRHAYGTWSAQAGVDAKTLSELMGHSDPRITLDLYCHTSLEAKRAAVERIPDLVSESRHKVHEDHEGEDATISESVH